MITLDKIIGAFELSEKIGCYLTTGFKISKTAPDSKDEVTVASNLLEDTEKVVERLRVEGTVEKCKKLSKLIPQYCDRFSSAKEDSIIQSKIRSIVIRIDLYSQDLSYIEELEQQSLECRKYGEKEKLDARFLVAADNTHIIDYPRILKLELVVLKITKRNLIQFREIFSTLHEWKSHLAKEGIFKSSKGKTLLFPSIETKSALELSLRLKAIKEIMKIMDSDLELRDDFASRIHHEIIAYRASRPDRALFCRQLLQFIIINYSLLNLQLPKEIAKKGGPSSMSRAYYITCLDSIAIKHFLYSIDNILVHAIEESFLNVWNKYFEKYKQLEAECTKKEASDEMMTACNTLTRLINEVVKGHSNLPLFLKDSALSQNPKDIWTEYCLLKAWLESPESEKSPNDAWVSAIESAPLPLSEKEKNLTFELPKAVLKNPGKSIRSRKPKKVTKAQKISKVAANVVKTAVSKPDLKVDTVAEKIDTLVIDSTAASLKGTSPTIDFGKLFPEPRLRFHERVLRWKRQDAMHIFDVDPNYTDKKFSESTKKRIIFEHGFANAVTAVAMTEGNITTNKADREKYGAFKRVQIVGEVVFDGTEERIQGVFSYSQNKNNLWFHVSFTQQESEASCKNYLKTGLYCIEYPILTKESLEVAPVETKYKVLEDGSFIQNVTDHVVTVRDPAHNATIYLARVKCNQ